MPKKRYRGVTFKFVTNDNIGRYRRKLLAVDNYALPTLPSYNSVALLAMLGKTPLAYCVLVHSRRGLPTLEYIAVAPDFQRRLGIGKLTTTKTLYVVRKGGGNNLTGYFRSTKEAKGIAEFLSVLRDFAGLSARGGIPKPPRLVSHAGVGREEHIVGGKLTRVGGVWRLVKSTEPIGVLHANQLDFGEAKQLSLPHEADVAKLGSLHPVVRERKLHQLRVLLRKQGRWNELAALEEAMPVTRRRIRKAYRKR